MGSWLLPFRRINFFGLLELGQLLLPFGGFLRLPRGFVELHEALKSFLHARFAERWNFILALLHAFVTREQQRPGFGEFLDDAQVAAVINYARSQFGNDYTDAVTADDVKAVR